MTKKPIGKDSGLSRKTQYLLIFSILILSVIVYAGCLKNGFVNWDDGKNVFENPDIRNAGWLNIKKIFSSFYLGMYQPLTTLSFLVDYKISALNPFQFHFTNLVFHLLNIWLVFILISKLTKNAIAALITALFFAIHPLHAESVCWVSERKDVLYAFFYLASLITWIHFLKSNRKTKFYFLSLFLFLLSLFSKSAAVTLPVLMILTDYYMGIKPGFRQHINKIPFFILAIIFGIVSIISQQVTDPGSVSSINYSLLNRFFFGMYALGFYIVNTLMPLKLSALHPFPAKIITLPALYYLASVFIAILIVLYFWLYRTQKVKREIKKELHFGIWFFLITLSLIIFIPVGQAVVAERYTYLSYIGPFFILGWFFSNLTLGKYFLKPLVKKGLWLLFVTLIFLFCIITNRRTAVWKDSMTLLTDIVSKYPNDAAVAYNNRSNELKPMGKYQEAMQDLNKAIAISPSYADAYSNRGLMNKDIGNFQQAVADLSKAISLNPKLYEAYYNRGLVYNAVSQFNSAVEDFNTCIKMNPAMEMAYNDRGISRAQMGDPYSAIADFTSAIQQNPMNPTPYFNRGFTLLNLQDQSGACSDFLKASQLGSEKAGQFLMNYCK
jgi:tetratricopeptide (TPR) repeat protein